MIEAILKEIFFTLEEAARLLRISMSTLRRRIKAGLIKASKVKRRVLIEKKELFDYLKRHQLSLES